MYEELVSHATRAGFHQYEIANFARNAISGGASIPASRQFEGSAREDARLTDTLPSLACRHNINYWRGGSFYGLGPSATSYVRGVRAKNWSNTQLYCEQLEKGQRAIESREELPSLARAGETAAFGLRMVAGWPFEQFRQTTGHDLKEEWSGEIHQLTQRGWGRTDAERFQLTPEGLRFADSAAELFLR
jgi:oxygen-independent coproporphyrinogen-3 oxidase